MAPTALLLSFLFYLAAARQYNVELVSVSQTPVVSHVNRVGQGYTPCNLTFNPSWLPAGPGLSQSGLLVRAQECPPEYGGAASHIMFVPCTPDGVCGDLMPDFALAQYSEDPRAFVYDELYYNYYYMPGEGLNTVQLARTRTPLNASSWEHVATLPWHRNGCIILRDDGTHYVIYGEGPPELPGLGIATTTDFVHYTVLNATFLEPLGPDQNEIKLEAGTAPVQLSTGDYLHFYAAATPGWVEHGNYTAGWVVLDGRDPSIILQRSSQHILVPTLPYMQGTDGYPWSRHNVVFLCSAVPTGRVDEFRLWFGAADASVGTAVVQVTLQ